MANCGPVVQPSRKLLKFDGIRSHKDDWEGRIAKITKSAILLTQNAKATILGRDKKTSFRLMESMSSNNGFIATLAEKKFKRKKNENSIKSVE